MLLCQELLLSDAVQVPLTPELGSPAPQRPF